jgi:8-oxo-dGTP pyrophosphatase MutT (NUDIX family)
MLSDFGKQLKHRLALPLPGREAQVKMAHAERRESISRFKVPEDARKGAVLILFFEEANKIKVPLILRQEYKGVHSGQVAFPGGKFEEGDEGLTQTALREAEEEIGIVKEDVQIIGRLTELYIPPSNFLVHPFVGVSETIPSFIPQINEVKEILVFDLDILLDESIKDEKEITLTSGLKIVTPIFRILNHEVWGATAMMLSELKILLKEIGEY